MKTKSKNINNFQCPDGYLWNDHGIYKVIPSKQKKQDDECKCISSDRIWISEVGEDLESGDMYVKVSWTTPGASIQTRLFSREQVYVARNLEKLTKAGLPICSDNAREISTFLFHFNRANYQILESNQFNIVSHFGLNGPIFCVGDIGLSPNSECPVVVTSEVAKQYLNYFKPHGSITKWKKAVDKIAPYPIPVFKLCASFLPPFMKLLGIDNTIINNYFESSTGKTTTDKIAISVWGSPKSGHLLRNWNISRPGLQEYVSLMHGLPIALDELTMKNGHDLKPYIYDFAGGGSRTRATKEGTLRASSNWHSICLSSGEIPLTGTGGMFQGELVRVVDIYGKPFNDGKLVEYLSNTVEVNYGAAGIEFMRQILSIPDIRAKLQDALEKTRNVILDNLEIHNQYTYRLSRFFAGVALMGDVVSQLLGILSPEITFNSVIEIVKECQSNFSEEGDDAERVLDYLRTYIATNQDNLHFTSNKDIYQGKQKVGIIKQGEYVAFFDLEKVLGKRYSLKRVVNDFYNREWLLHDIGRRQKSIKTGNVICRPYAIKWDILFPDSPNMQIGNPIGNPTGNREGRTVSIKLPKLPLLPV